MILERRSKFPDPNFPRCHEEYFQAIQAKVQGIFNENLSYNIWSVTDGISNTIIFGERAQGKFSQTEDGAAPGPITINMVSGPTRMSSIHRSLP
jgi:hypothetical protein